MLSGLELVLALLVVLAGSLVMGLVSFGLGMVLSPILLLFLEPRTVVISINSLTVPILALVLFQGRHLLPLRQVLPMAIAGIIGVPVGVLILDSASPAGLRIAIAIVILILVVPTALNVQLPFKRTGITSPIFGFLGAMLVTGMGVGTPLVVLYLVNQKWPASTIRASIAFFSLMVAITAVTIYGFSGMYTEERVKLIFQLVPMVLLGVGVASILVRHVDDRRLRQAVLIVVVAASIGLLGKEVVGL